MKKTLNSKLKVLLLLCLTIFSNCSKEDILSEPIEENNQLIETVSINEAKDLFKKNNSLLSVFSKSSAKSYAVPNLDKIEQEAIKNSKEFITVIPAITPDKGVYSRILMLKIKGEIKSVVFNMSRTKKEENQKFTGKIFITELDGSFLYGYRVDKGKTIAKLIKSKGSKKASKSITLKGLHLMSKANPEEGSCPYSDPSWCELDEVVITVSNNNDPDLNNYNSIYIPAIYDSGWNSGYDNSYNDYNNTSVNNITPGGISWNYGGGGGSTSSTSSIASSLLNTLSTTVSLSQSQRQWVLNSNNISHVTSLSNFLDQNNNSTEAKEFVKWEIEFETLPKVPCGINHDCVKSIKTMATGLRRFHGEEGKLMADYFDSLVTDFSTFSLSDLQVFYDTAYDITTQFNANMRKAIMFGFIEGVTPIIEIALLEVGGPVAIKLLQKIPVSWVYRGTRLNNMIKKVSLLGEAGVQANVRVIKTSSPISKSKELFNSLTKHALSKSTNAQGTIVANMGNGNYITYRTVSSTGFPATVNFNFQQVLGTNNFVIKFGL